MATTKTNRVYGFLIFGAVLFGVIWLATRKEPAMKVGQQPQPDSYIPRPPRLQSASPSYESQPSYNAEKDALAATGGKRYLNTETWDIAWSNDGLPTQITIHRDAIRT